MGRVEHPGTEPSLEWLIGRLDLANVDLILAEGFHFERCPKVEVYRPAARTRAALRERSRPDRDRDRCDLRWSRIIDLNDTAAIAALIRARLTPASTLANAV